MEKTNYVEEAKFLASIGISVIPVREDGSKMPSIKWKEFQERIMDDIEIQQHFSKCGGVIALTGNISNLLCIDFDLDKQRESDDFWGKFMSRVPEDMKKKMLVNQTRSGGFHVWIRTDYEDKSRKLTHRPLTMPELLSRYDNLVANGASEETATNLLLKKPVECVIETRSRGSYGVFLHHQYKRFYGTSLNHFSEKEVEMLLEIAYSYDYNYKKPKPYTGPINGYKVLSKFNEDCSAKDVLAMIEGSGLFELHDIDPNGNYRLKRLGSDSPFSAYIYKDTANVHVFGLNPFTEEDKNTLTPFEVYCGVNDIDESEAIEKLSNNG